MSLLRTGYVGLSWLGAPFISAYLRWRTFKGHEDQNRLPERRGVTRIPRPQKSLLWVHAVSVGEAIAALTIIQAILKKYPQVQALLTTTTLSSAKVLETRLPKNVIHQFCPVDTPQAVRRFLKHWQPDLAIWIESELWPNLLHETQEKGIPTILLNGRMSSRSFSRWKKMKGMIAPLLSRLELCAVQSENQASYFQSLGAKKVSIMGNVKLMMTPLDVDMDKYQTFKKAVGDRPLWLAASTHPGEEEIVFRTHKALQEKIPHLLTILVPRHVERATELQQLALKEGLSTTLRTKTSSFDKADIYIANTLGEMELFYTLAPVVFMGATFVSKGGHNPIEAAQKGAFILHGPHTFNNHQLYETLASLGLSTCVSDQNSLPGLILPWLAKQKGENEEPLALQTYRQEGLQNLMILLAPYLKTLKEERE